VEIQLSRPYRARGGAPVIRRVDAAVFTARYFARCLACGFCRDACCDHGVDVDIATVGRILAQGDALARRVGLPSARWFDGEVVDDDDAPGGAMLRTRAEGGGCVFRSRTGRGCELHAYAVETGQDYHELKPMVSTLFPITFAGGLLCLSEELTDGSLVCAGDGPTAYEAVRGELEYYFGADFVVELDSLRAQSLAT
jgi:hypothetical protein